jgi:2'-5' RNA ligase
LFDESTGVLSWPHALPPPRPPAAPGFHSLFFAALPEPADAERLHAHGRRVQGQLGIAGRALEAERLHVTLHLVGGYVDEPAQVEIARWCRAAAAVRRAPFEVVFDRVATFGGDGHPLAFTSSSDVGLRALHEAVGMALADTGERIKRQHITPHMTLSYRGKRLAETAIEPVCWRAGELVLIDSHVGEHVHEVIGRWPLRE